ncbi:protein-tyrosine phosphatase [Salmonella enterica subsp. enterica]|uniref:protein-tyrosine-phosphatase n=1 Tax=Salmonella enterica I TaxID=59201 RepID=A0A447PEP7_SALET|nr:protein-tyrosine phosphatase [Salmonella enterica subsp. enterica]
MFNKILVVCVGNVCRSPTAERLLKRFHPSLTVASAGLGALVGKGADPAAASVASAHDLSLENHCARQISARLCREYDLILTMGETSHRRPVRHCAGNARQGNAVWSLGQRA